MTERTLRRAPKKTIGLRLPLMSLGVLLAAGPVSAIDVRDNRNEAPFVGPPGYTFCARQGEHCRFQGTVNVAYGAGGYSDAIPFGWVFKFGVTGGIDCQDNRFPAFSPPVHYSTNVKRACYIKDALDHRGTGPGGQGGGPAGFTKCAEDGQRCAFRGTADVAWGAGRDFLYKEAVANGIDCRGGAFPASSTVKVVGHAACYMKLLPEKAATPTPVPPTKTPAWHTPTPTPIVHDHR